MYWSNFASCRPFKTHFWRKERKTGGTEEDVEDVSSYWMTLRKTEDIGNWKGEHYISHCGKKALDILQDGLLKDVRNSNEI